MEAYLGPNFGIFNPEATVYLSSTIEDLGYSGINGANTLAFAAELYQRDILTKEDLNGVEPKWGDANAFAELAKRVVARENVYYDALAEGTYRAALKISKLKGVDVTPYAVHVKGVEIGVHGIRRGRDYTYDICYACSVQGGDHTSTVKDAYNDMEAVFDDSAVYCNVIGWGEGGTKGLQWKFLHAITDWDMTEREWKRESGPRVVHIPRAAKLIGGPDISWRLSEDDDNPPRFYKPLPSGPYKGFATRREDMDQKKAQYYKAIGWDKKGIPKPSVLKKLGLNDVDKALDKVR